MIWWLAEIIMFFSSFISGMLGIGGEALKVLGLDWAMNLPMKVSTATNNFMTGVTAATSGWIWPKCQYIELPVAVVRLLCWTESVKKW